jgi:hypothetical protein
MTDAANDLEQATIVEFFARMNAQGVEYALLRNYEQYPRFGHDVDLILRWDHLPRWKAIAKSCADDFGWSALTDCDHWARSSSREHCIQALRFYALDSEQYLEIDAFHALLLLGLPLASEDAVLRGRVWDERGFYRVDPHFENLFRLLQIARLAGINGAQAKLERYRTRALSFWNSAGNLKEFAAGLGLPKLARAVEYLAAGDTQSFKTQVDRQKRAWLIRWLLAQPLRGIKIMFDRFEDYMRLLWLRPCGFEVSVFARTGDDRRRLEQIMAGFMETNFIHAFTASKNLRKRRWVLERGGIVVNWAPEDRAQVAMAADAGDRSAKDELVRMIVDRHHRITDRRLNAS